MPVCEVCKNEYDKPIMITVAGVAHTFDSFECAVHALAPVCDHCGCRILGHGVEANGATFCCAHCAKEMGHHTAKDNVTESDTGGTRSGMSPAQKSTASAPAEATPSEEAASVSAAEAG